MPVFHYVNPPTIYWGARSVEHLSKELENQGVKRPFLITTTSLAENKAVLKRLPGTKGHAVIGQHAPHAQVECAIEAARKDEPDGVVSLGGGSPIDAAKIVAFELGRLPHVAIPTTLSAAELSPGAGFTDEAGQKVGRREPGGLTPNAVIYDSELALRTPLELWLSTGIRALDHAVETILEPGEHPYSDTLALEGARRLFTSLPQALARPGVIEIRTENQIAAWLSYSLPQAAYGLSHVLGKQIGSPFGIPHGVTSCLLLPHVMRYRARTQAGRLALLAPALGVDRRGASAEELALAACDAVFGLIRKLGLPQHLNAYKLSDEQLRAAAEPLAGDRYPLEDLVTIYRAAA